MKRLLACALIAIALRGADPKPAISEQEQRDLSNALRQAGASPVENLRAIDKHLAKYPGSPRRPGLERAAVRAAIEAQDDQRLILYGERVLAREAGDASILERVTRALLLTDTRETSERALQYARRYEEIARQQLADGPPSGAGKSEWRNGLDRSLGQALTYEARATGNLGRFPAAITLAQRAFDAYPNGESAREIARWLERSGEPEAASRHLADAFTIPDPRTTDADRARDRARMGELWRQAKGSDAGLGDLLLEAFDRNVALVHARELRLRDNDPNARLSNPMEFTLSGLDRDKLSMAGLKGKTLVLDFWATWCVPCRAEHPLYQQIKQRFQDNSDVVFLSISTDDDRQAVKLFLAEQKWQGPVWFEDGLSRALAIASIPTTIVIDRSGKVFSRMNGYEPEHFVEILSERIQDALAVQ
jgi:thiol-disulfide isomerase/thioredoxin